VMQKVGGLVSVFLVCFRAIAVRFGLCLLAVFTGQ
jgi:hypothetical protein